MGPRNWRLMAEVADSTHLYCVHRFLHPRLQRPLLLLSIPLTLPARLPAGGYPSL
jgi:hypothetical protein